MKHIVIVNGKPASGKTTFQEICRELLDASGVAHCHIVSSIDPIKEIYKQLGWDGEKTDKARKDLHILKKMWTDNCNGPMRYITNRLMKLSWDKDHIMFVDIREESEIIKLMEVFDNLAYNFVDVKCTTVFISRSENDGLEYGNKSDDDVGSNMSIYNHKIANDGDLYELRKTAIKFLEGITKEEK